MPDSQDKLEFNLPREAILLTFGEDGADLSDQKIAVVLRKDIPTHAVSSSESDDVAERNVLTSSPYRVRFGWRANTFATSSRLSPTTASSSTLECLAQPLCIWRNRSGKSWRKDQVMLASG